MARLSLCAVVVAMLAACASAPMAGGGLISSVSFGEGDQMRIDLLGPSPTSSSRVLIIVKNRLDRSVSLDFDGPSHYELTVGDNREGRLRVVPGLYQIRGAAAALASIPPGLEGYMEAGNRYDINVYFSRRPVDPRR